MYQVKFLVCVHTWPIKLILILIVMYKAVPPSHGGVRYVCEGVPVCARSQEGEKLRHNELTSLHVALCCVPYFVCVATCRSMPYEGLPGTWNT